MNKLLWTFQVLLALVFGVFGFQKVVMPIPDLIEQGMLWIEDFPAWQVRAIGLLEVLGAIGLIVPRLIKALPDKLVAAAAGGLAVTMIGAVVTHITRADPVASIAITTALFGMSATVAVARFSDGTARADQQVAEAA